MNKRLYCIYQFVLNTPANYSVRSFILWPLWVIAIFYTYLVLMRNSLKSILPFRLKGVLLISVGNLTVGGTGKTPLTLFLAHHFKSKGYKTGIVMRGYKRRSGKSLLVLTQSDLSGLSPTDTGDEAYLLASNVTDTPIALCANRKRAIKHLARKHKVNCIILDDGFSQVHLKTDLNILCFDSHRPFGNGCLIPRGILREPVYHAKRAHIFVFPKGKPKIKIWRNFQSVLGPVKRPCFFGDLLPASIIPLMGGTSLSLNDALFTHTKGLVMSGIGNPQSFVETCLYLYFSFETLIFPDHHTYTEDSMHLIHKCTTVKNLNWIMTTEKDISKLKGFKFSVPVFYLKMEWVPQPELLTCLDNLGK